MTNDIERLRKSAGDGDNGLDGKITIVDEGEAEISNVSEDRVMFSCQEDEVSLGPYAEQAEGNNNMACDKRLEEADMVKLVKHMVKMPKAGDDFDLIRARFKHGNLEVLIAPPNSTSIRMWIPLHLHPSALVLICQVVERDGQIRITGSPRRFYRDLRM